MDISRLVVHQPVLGLACTPATSVPSSASPSRLLAPSTTQSTQANTSQAANDFLLMTPDREPPPKESRAQPPRRPPTKGASSNKRVRKHRWLELGPPAYPEWHPFSLDNFPTYDREEFPSIHELHAFIRELDAAARWASTAEEYVAQTMRTLADKPGGKKDVIRLFPSLIPTAPSDITLLRDAQDLDRQLNSAFLKPLLHRAALSASGSLSPRTWSSAEFWAVYKADPARTVDVYDYSKPEPESTSTWTMEAAYKHWSRPRVERHAINILDIENRLGDFCPNAIITHDLSHEAALTAQVTMGKTHSSWIRTRTEFFLLSEANAISPIHIDNGGHLTWILILEGRKIWYFPKKVTPAALRFFGEVGAKWTAGYDGGWVRVELCPGDLFVMPPSWPHAVFTPDDCLTVGGHFYTKAHIGNSLAGLALQEKSPGVSNEDLKPDIYDALAAAVQHLGPLEPDVAGATLLAGVVALLGPTPEPQELAPSGAESRRNRARSPKRRQSKPSSHQPSAAIEASRQKLIRALESARAGIFSRMHDLV